MNSVWVRTCVAASVVLLGSCSQRNDAPPVKHDDALATLSMWMTGSFSSAVQAAADPEFFDIRLEMAPIWTDRADGPWLYVEQAVSSNMDRPYRQRIYHLVRVDGNAIRSDVYTLPGEALRFAGAFRAPAESFTGISPADLKPRDGCSITLLRKDAESFTGSTHGRDCPSERSGAAFATSDVLITSMGMTTWDRGFDATGKQVWGSEKGPYIFERAQ